MSKINNQSKFIVSIGSSNRQYRQEDYDTISDNVIDKSHELVWKNDTLTSIINILSKGTHLENLNAEVSDFLCEENVLGKENITIKTIKNVKGQIGRGFTHGQIPDYPKEEMPDIIYKALPTDVNSNTLQSLWLSINIPKSIKAGIYTGSIRFSASNVEDLEDLSFTIEVLDVISPELGTDNSLSIELWQYPYSVARYYGIKEENLFKEKHLEILKAHLLEYKQVGGRSITTTIVEDAWNHQTYDKYPSMVKWIKNIDGTFTYDFTHFDAYVELALSLGIDTQIKSFSIVPWENRIFYYDEETEEIIETRPKPGTSEWNHLWSSFLKAYVKHLDEKAWFDITYIALDERPTEDLNHVVNLIKKHPNKNGKHLKIHAAMNFNSIENPILDKIDDISLGLGYTKHESDELRKLSNNRRQKGFTTTIYTATEDYPNSFAYSNPSESAWSIWYAASHKTDGFLRWALDAWVENPLEDISHWYWESGDPFFIYPSDKKSFKPYTSPRFEKLKEGMRDVTKANYLASLNSNNKVQIDELLRSIKRAEGVLNEYGAKVAGSKENKNMIDAEVKRLKDEINIIAKASINK